MRFTATVMALSALGALFLTGWAAGCNGLSKDCALNLTCPPVDAGTDSGTDAGAGCKGVFAVGACDTCLQGACCQAIVDCKDDPHCLHCLNTTTPNDPLCTGAATQKVYNAFIGCEGLHCATACVATDYCNPITNNGCGTDGSSCDASGSPATFVCFAPPNSAQLCGACNANAGPYCAPGLHCYNGLCARYCCTDADCGTGACELDPAIVFNAKPAIKGDAPGICLQMLIPDGGTGPDGGAISAACDAPATSTSKGSCFGGYAGM